MARNTLKLFGVLITPLILLFAVACSGDSVTEAPPATAATTAAPPTAPPGQPTEKINVVTTSNIVADWVRAVGQKRVDVFSLLPPDADPHTFQPGARDITRIADASLVFSVGLSLEAGWLDKLVENAAQDPDAIVALGEAVDPIDFLEIVDEHAVGTGLQEEEAGDDGEGEEHGALDPHFWFDPLRVKQAVNSIAVQLSTADPAGRSFYRDNAAAYNRELDDLHAWIQEQVATLPEEDRLLVMSHDSFQYFAARYGFEVAGVIFTVTTDSEPTAQEFGALIGTIEHEGVPAVFTEKSHSDRLARRIAEETGATLVVGLYTGSLSNAGGDAGTYLNLMRHNTKTIVEALK